MARLERDFLFLEVAKLFSQRSTCERGQVGTILVVENRIIASGYNGAPPGMKHCTEIGCKVLDPEQGCQRAIHAEANAIAWAARAGAATKNATMYSTHAPCLACAKLIVSAGIWDVCYVHPYRNELGLKLLDKALVEVHQLGP
jgi:dCMP deaminase